MGSLFNRMKNAIAADVHELLDQKEEKNPMAMLNHYLRQCEQETNNIRKLVERQYALKDEFKREYQEAKSKSEKRAKQMELAQLANEDELYQYAKLEKEQYEERADQLRASAEKAERDLAQLEQKYEQMKHKLKDMYIKRMDLMGRENVARANHGINKVLEPSSFAQKTMFRFEELEQFIERLEHKVTASYHQSTLDARFAQLEKDLKKEETSTRP